MPSGRVSQTTNERKFWNKVVKLSPDECWPWLSSLSRKAFGYGIFRVKIDDVWTHALAHRFSWELHIGPIPEGMRVLHRCDNPPCSNPAHLFLGTQAENVADMMTKHRDRHPRGEQHGKSTVSDVIIRRILELRAAGLSGHKIAALVGCSRTQVQKVYSGRIRRDITAALAAEQMPRAAL